MEAAKIFLEQFCPTFIGITLGASFAWWLLTRVRADARLPFLAGPFPELSAYGKEEQRRLLHEASVMAFPHWRLFVPVIVLAGCVGTGAAVGHVLSETDTIPDSLWIRMGIAAVCGVLGYWLTCWMTTRYVRQFLRTCLERRNQKAT